MPSRLPICDDIGHKSYRAATSRRTYHAHHRALDQRLTQPCRVEQDESCFEVCKVLGGKVYRPEKAGYNDIPDVDRLASYLGAQEPERWTVSDLKGLRGGPIEWTKDNHFRTRQFYRVYRWDGSRIAVVQDWFASVFPGNTEDRMQIRPRLRGRPSGRSRGVRRWSVSAIFRAAEACIPRRRGGERTTPRPRARTS